MEPLKEETPFLQLSWLRLFIPPMTDPWGWIIYLLKKVKNSHMNKGTWLGENSLQGSYRYLITYLVSRVWSERNRTNMANKIGKAGTTKTFLEPFFFARIPPTPDMVKNPLESHAQTLVWYGNKLPITYTFVWFLWWKTVGQIDHIDSLSQWTLR